MNSVENPLLQWTENLAHFMGSCNTYGEASAVLLGIPMDYTVSFRAGSRHAPTRMREVSYGLEEYSPYLNRSLDQICFFDAGDLALPMGNAAKSLEVIRPAVRQILADRKIPICMGGEHLVSYPILQEVLAVYPDAAVVHFDAHADLRTDYLGEQNSHAAVIRRVAEEFGPERIYQFGIRSGTQEEFEYGRAKTHFHPYKALWPLQQELLALQGRPIYVTLDIDVVDPAHAPGTGTAEPGGVTATEILEAIHALRELNVVGFDLVEVCPPLDSADITSLLGAKLIREALLMFSR